CCVASIRVIYSFPTRRSSDLFSTVGLDHFVYVPDFGSQIILHDTLYQFKEKVLTAFLKLNFETKQALDKGGHKKVQIYNVVNSRSEEHTSELQSRENLVCRLL